MFKRVASLVAVLLVSFFSIANGGTVTAIINSCSANVDTHQVAPSTETTFHFSVTNTDTSDINFVRITAPDGFTILGNSSDGWIGSTSQPYAYESDSVLSPGDTMDIDLDAQAANSVESAQPWVVETTDNPGQDFFSCSGNLSTSITGTPVDLTPPNIFNIAVDSVTSKSIRINWQTDEDSTSEISYGPDNGYGNSAGSTNNLVSTHSVQLTGLQPNTGYHFQVVSTDRSGNVGSSSDNTFLTATTDTVLQSGSSQTPAIGVKVTNPGDKTPPSISLISKIPSVVQSSLSVSGVATDNSSIVKVEYSTDGGKDWLSAEKTAGLNTKSASFTITPPNLDDGNYSFVARAIDGGGNITPTMAVKLVIDRQPPIVGGAVFSLGPQLLQPESSGVIDLLPSVDERVTISVTGGPTVINLGAQASSSKDTHIFSLAPITGTGLWSGVVGLDHPGEYTLTADSVDGAGNKTTKVLSEIRVLDYSSVTNENNQPLKAYLTVYRFSIDSNNWGVWDGGPYNQPNPQQTDQNGHFSYFLPEGKYYVKASAAGYRNLITKIINVSNPSPLEINLKLTKSGFKPFDLITSLQATQTANKTTAQMASHLSSLLGHPGPDFVLSSTSGQNTHLVNLAGKPTDLIFINTWAPSAASQLAVLPPLAANHNINTVPIAVQQGVAELQAYNSIAGYNLNWLSDPSGLTAAAYKSSFVPTHYFLDRDGVVRKIVTGNLSQSEILSDLSGL